MKKEELDKLKENIQIEVQSTKYEKYAKTKIQFLFENYDKKRTISTYWNLFQKYVLPVELNYGKEISFFNKNEAEEFLASLLSASKSSKNGVGSLCSMYVDWMLKVKRVRIGSNPFEALNIQRLISTNGKIIKSELLSWDDFIKMVDVAEKSEMFFQDILITMLARIGLQGKNCNLILNVRHRDIDRENNRIRMADDITGEILCDITIPKKIRSIFYDYLDTAKVETNNLKGWKLYERDDRVLKSRVSNAQTLSSPVLYKAITKFFEANDKKVLPLKKLVRCAKFDVVDSIYNNKKELSSDDFKNVNSSFDSASTESTYFKLKDEYCLVYPKRAESIINLHRKKAKKK